MKTARELAADRYQGERGELYHKQMHGSQMASDRVYDAKARLARHRYFGDLPESARVFEFGVGTGHNLSALRIAERTGYDVSETVLEICRRKGIEVFSRFDDVPHNRYDVVVCRHVLEHLPDPAEVLIKLREKLTPTGHLLLILPVEHRPRHQRRLNDDDPHQHLYCWKLGHIANLLRICGLEVVRHRYEWYSMQRLLSWIPELYGDRAYHMAVTVAGLCRRQSEMLVWAKRIDSPQTHDGRRIRQRVSSLAASG